MGRTARRGNVRAIRPGVSIPQQRDEDIACITTARIVAAFTESAQRLALTAPDSPDRRMAEHMARQGTKLPCNNLRLLVTSPTPREEWFDLAWRDYDVARGVWMLAEAQWSRVWHLDRWDGGDRAKTLDAARQTAHKALDIVTLDLLRTPAAKKWQIGQKQRAVGKREWAEKYRPEWQAIIDEDAARFAPKSRRSAKEGC